MRGRAAVADAARRRRRRGELTVVTKLLSALGPGRASAGRRDPVPVGRARRVVDRFHDLYYCGLWRRDDPPWKQTFWMGVACQKCPLDLWIYQEILFETRPDLILETGSLEGGSALFLAHMCELLGRGRVVSIDIEDRPRPRHSRITYVAGSSADPQVIERAAAGRRPGDRVMVILDSDHSEAHVTRELRGLAPLVSVGCYLVVEDTNVNGHPTYRKFGPGPWEATQRFLAENPDFIADRTREKLLLTFNPCGYLRRVR